MGKVSSCPRRLLYVLLKTAYDRNMNKVRHGLGGGKNGLTLCFRVGFFVAFWV